MPASCWWPYPGGGGYRLYWKSASPRGDGSGWSQLKTVWLLMESWFCGWSPSERPAKLLIDAWVFHVWWIFFRFTGSWVTVQLWRWAAAAHERGYFLEPRASRGDAVTDLWDDTNFLLPTKWDWLILERKPIQNELKIDVRGPSIPRYFGKHERRQWMCVLEDTHRYLAIGISASKFSNYCMQEEKK